MKSIYKRSTIARSTFLVDQMIYFCRKKRHPYLKNNVKYKLFLFNVFLGSINCCASDCDPIKFKLW